MSINKVIFVFQMSTEEMEAIKTSDNYSSVFRIVIDRKKLNDMDSLPPAMIPCEFLRFYLFFFRRSKNRKTISIETQRTE